MTHFPSAKLHGGQGQEWDLGATLAGMCWTWASLGGNGTHLGATSAGSDEPDHRGTDRTFEHVDWLIIMGYVSQATSRVDNVGPAGPH